MDYNPWGHKEHGVTTEHEHLSLSLIPNYLPSASSPNVIILKLRASMCGFGWQGGIPFIPQQAVQKYKKVQKTVGRLKPNGRESLLGVRVYFAQSLRSSGE